MLVVGEPVPVIRGDELRVKGYLLAEEVGETSKLRSVSRGVIVEFINGDSMKFHVGRYRKFLYFVSSRINTLQLTDCSWAG